MTNYFEQVGDQQTVAPVRRREQRAVHRAERRSEKSALDKRNEENAYLWKMYRRTVRKEQDGLREASRSGLAAVLRLLRRLPYDRCAELTEHVLGAPWIASLGKDHRMVLWQVVSSGVVRIRTRSGLLPFDDGGPFFGTPLTEEQKISQYLIGR